MNKHVARKRFGQNFLIDRQVIADIVNAIAPPRDGCVVEIGPGLGALTEPLLQRLDRLQVVEIDRDIIARLKQRFPADRLCIHEGDALDFDFGALAERGGLQIVGNLPYNISTPLLFHLSAFAERVRDMHFMLQKEVVARMVADPGTADYGRLSVMLQYRYVMDWLFDVPPESFDPAPKVDSAVVRMIPRPQEELQAEDEKTLSSIVAAAFSQRRKMLRNTLKGVLDEQALSELGISPTARAEELPVAAFVGMANCLHRRGGASAS